VIGEKGGLFIGLPPQGCVPIGIMIGYVTAGYLTANGFAVSLAFYAQVRLWLWPRLIGAQYSILGSLRQLDPRSVRVVFRVLSYAFYMGFILNMRSGLVAPNNCLSSTMEG
jgi:hypothetical protein